MGPLKGLRIIEMAGIGPAPFCGMLLSDMGAEVIRVDRREKTDLGLPGKEPKFDVLHRGRKIGRGGRQERRRTRCRASKLVAKARRADRGFPPGRNGAARPRPRRPARRQPAPGVRPHDGLRPGRPDGPRAGHDINYIALAGVLHTIGRKGEAPMPPLNLVGDFGGGGMLLGFGVVCALLEAQRSGKGQVVDAAMVDGAATLMSAIYGFRAQGTWKDERGVNVLDTGAPYYNVYETKRRQMGVDRRHREAVLRGSAGPARPRRREAARPARRTGWPELAQRFAEAIRTKTRAEWEKIFEGSDACFAPVLSMGEVADYPHNAARNAFVSREGVVQPAPAPRFSRTVPEMGAPRRSRAPTPTRCSPSSASPPARLRI